ncbi:MAG: hypothetical protein WCC06_11035 [Candidatus Aminicenantales bacterium]
MSQNLPVSLHLKVITPHRLLCEDDVDEVTLPGLEGYLGILPGHRPLVLALGKGKIKYRQGKTEVSHSVQGGYAEVLPEKILVFTEVSDGEEDEPAQG